MRLVTRVPQAHRECPVGLGLREQEESRGQSARSEKAGRMGRWDSKEGQEEKAGMARGEIAGRRVRWGNAGSLVRKDPWESQGKQGRLVGWK